MSYVIFKQDSSKPALGRVLKYGQKRYEIVPEYNTERGIESSILVLKEKIVADLGPNPLFGRAYNLWIEPHRVNVPSAWGVIRVYRKVDKKGKDRVLEALEFIYDTLENLLTEEKLHSFLPINIDIRNAHGAYVGTYQYSHQHTDTLVMRPKHFSDLDSLEQILAHEIGHGVWFNLVSNHAQSEWVKMFKRMFRVKGKTKDPLKRLYTKLKDGKYKSLGVLEKTLDLEENQIYDSYISYISSNFNLSKRHFELVWVTDGFDKSLWPKNPMDLVDTEKILTDYACKNPEEFFAEAFRLGILPQNTLPSIISSLLEVTLREIRKADLSEFQEQEEEE